MAFLFRGIAVAAAALAALFIKRASKATDKSDVSRLSASASMHDPSTGNGLTGVSGTVSYSNARGPWYSTLPSSRVFFISGAIAALTIGAATLPLSAPYFSSVQFNASQMPGVHSLLESVTGQRLPDDLTGNVFFQTDHVARLPNPKHGIGALWVSKNVDGSYSLNKVILDSNGLMVGPTGPEGYVPAFDVASDGTIQPRQFQLEVRPAQPETGGEPSGPPQINARFANAISAQAAMLSANEARLSPEDHVAALRLAAAQGHQVGAIGMDGDGD
jgi:hypothetical protein